MWDLKGKTALVTGGSKGIGQACVRELLQLNAIVLFSARNEEEVKALEHQLQSENFNVFGIVADVSTAEGREYMYDWIHKHWDGLDILINNAGINIRKKALDYSEEEVQRVIDINLIAPFALSRKLHPLLKKSGRGSIINVSSVAASQDVGTGTPYAMAKAGLLQQSRSLAVEWAGENIRVNAVSPWFTRTPLTEGYLKQDKKSMPILKRTPLNRIAEAEEIAAAVAFLAMDKSSYITGQNIIADGGMSINAI